MLLKSKWDFALAVLLVASSVLWGALYFSTAKTTQGKRSLSAWRSQEMQVKKKLEAISLNEKTLREKILRQSSLRWRLEIASIGGLLLLAGSFWGLLRLVLRALGRKENGLPLGEPPPPTWRSREVFRLVALVIVAAEVSLLAQWALIRLFHFRWADRHLAALGSTLLLDGLVIAGVSWFLLRGSKKWLSWSRITSSVRFAVVNYVTFLPIVGLIMILAVTAAQWLKIEPEPQMVFTMYMSESRSAVLGSMLLLVAIIGPVAEEFFFRGFLYRWLRVRVGVRRGLLLSAALFAGLHMNFIVFFPILGLGLLFGWAYERTGTLAAPIAIHVLHNSGMLFLASLLKEILSLS